MPISEVYIWIALNVLVFIGIAGTLVPICWAFLERISIDKPPIWLEEADVPGEHKKRIVNHYLLIAGTLKFWKNKAAAHEKLHVARKIWSIIASVSLPALVQIYNPHNDGFYAHSFVTVFTVFSGFIVLLAYSFKAEEKYRGFRRYESEYYDIARRLISRPAETGEDLKKQLDEYIDLTEEIRKAGRNIETGDIPSVIESKFRKRPYECAGCRG